MQQREVIAYRLTNGVTKRARPELNLGNEVAHAYHDGADHQHRRNLRRRNRSRNRPLPTPTGPMAYRAHPCTASRLINPLSAGHQREIRRLNTSARDPNDVVVQLHRLGLMIRAGRLGSVGETGT